jgi:hypothetical protein
MHRLWKDNETPLWQDRVALEAGTGFPEGFPSDHDSCLIALCDLSNDRANASPRCGPSPAEH